MDLQLTGKRVLVTGSSAGIGKAIARTFADEGALVAITGRDARKIETVAKDIRAHTGRPVVSITADLPRVVPDVVEAGGDSDANSIWCLENDGLAAFVGDFLYSENHAYMMDGSILRWIPNLTWFEELLETYATLYVGHGPASNHSLVHKQKRYFDTACAALLEATAGSAVLTDDAKKKYEQTMLTKYPGYGFTLTVVFSADALARELIGVKNYDW